MEVPCYDRSFRGTLSIITLLFVCTTALGQLTVDNSMTPEELVRSILAGQGVSVSNIKFNGVPGNQVNDQIGSFNGASSNIGLTSGILLATGRIEVVTGPNTVGDATLPPSSPHNIPDPDLRLLAGAFAIGADVAVLEFDIIPAGDSISFQFVFGSEEYPEYVCSPFNDVFGLFLSGPGIDGPFTNDAINLALVPGSTYVPIAINTVNPGVPGQISDQGCRAIDPNWRDNAIHYVDNTGGTTHQLDGTTVPLMASARVQCGETYHIKIAIMDVTDNKWDSAVFLEGGSLSSPGVSASLVLPGPGEDLVEGCGTATLVIERTEEAGDRVVIIGAAGAGITPGDVSGLPAQVVLPDGVSSVSLDFVAVDDGIVEGKETLTILVTSNSICGHPISIPLSLTIADYEPVSIAAEDVRSQCDRDSVLLDPLVEGGLGALSFSWNTGSTATAILVPAMTNGEYALSITDECPRTATAKISVISGCDLVIPNVISPNGDGLNDHWVIEGIEGMEHTVRVYNRWGQVVMETAEYKNTWNGAGAPDGTYFYEIRSIQPEQRTYTGTLTILSGER